MPKNDLTLIDGNVEQFDAHTRELLHRYVYADDTSALRELCDISARLSRKPVLYTVGDARPARHKYLHRLSAMLTQLKH